MTPFGATYVVNITGYMTPSKEQGQNFHRIGSLLPVFDGVTSSHKFILMLTKIIDVISAELPNHIEDAVLFETIQKHMIHGPYGELNLNSPCMKYGKCTKRYPREQVHETQTGGDRYPLYKRREPSDGG